MIELEAYDAEKCQPRSFELYEEFSQRKMAETIRTRRDNFDKADLEARKELATEVKNEVESFCIWLQETKRLPSTVAHYYSVSLKSLLVGLSMGVQVACLFDIILNAQIR